MQTFLLPIATAPMSRLVSLASSELLAAWRKGRAARRSERLAREVSKLLGPVQTEAAAAHDLAGRASVLQWMEPQRGFTAEEFAQGVTSDGRGRPVCTRAGQVLVEVWRHPGLEGILAGIRPRPTQGTFPGLGF